MACLSLPVGARKVRLSLKAPVVEQKSSDKSRKLMPKTEELDSIRVAQLADSITFAGFDKPLQSTRETFFVTNNTPIPIAWIALDITYLDMDGRMLHRREVRIDIDLPQGETRLASVKSFDLQKSLYYHRSHTSKRSTAIPFTVEIAVRGIGRRL